MDFVIYHADQSFCEPEDNSFKDTLDEMRPAWCGCGQTFRILADLRIYIHPEAVLGNPSIEEKK
jgi:hypothetical protein